MSDSFPLRPRRVVTGFKDGRSTIIADGSPPTIFDTPVFKTAEIWRTSALPADLRPVETTAGSVQLEPPAGGLLARFVYFPPQSETDGEDFGAALGEMGGEAAHDEEGRAGMHTTDTLDVIYVVSGEVYAVMDDGEALLRAGDSLIQRGTSHAWEVRGDLPAVILAVQCEAAAATRPRDD